MEIHVFGEPAVGPAGVVSIFGFSQPLWVVSTVLHGSPKKLPGNYLHVEIPSCWNLLPGCTGCRFPKKKTHTVVYPLVNDHIAMAGISPCSIGTTSSIRVHFPAIAMLVCWTVINKCYVGLVCLCISSFLEPQCCFNCCCSGIWFEAPINAWL